MLRKLTVILSVVSLCLVGTVPVLAQKIYPTLTNYEKVTGEKITKFNEAPILKTMVAAGELPSVEERLPEEPLVVEPLEEIGQYGGTLTSGAISIESAYDMWNTRQFYLAATDPEMNLFLHVPKSYDLSEDYKTFTLHLRKGLKWSDGAPYTADDIMFWYEDIVLNDELTPRKPKAWSPGGELVKVERVDDYTVRFEFAAPYPSILLRLTTGMSRPLISRPKHYLKEWHPNYNPEANELAKKEGYDNWWKCFAFHSKAKFGQDVNLPTTFPWVLRKATTTQRIYERNPYYWMVDTAGNQLPYIDKAVAKLVETTETYNLKAIAGELGYAAHDLLIENYSLYKKNEEKGGYEIRLWKGDRAAEYMFGFNLTHKDPVLRKIFNDIRFRQAMSLSIDRDEINDLFYFGKAVPRQATVLPTSSSYEPWMEDYYAEYNPERANRLLDEMGLTKRDKEGYRLRPDGKPLLILLAYVQTEGTKAKISELIKDYWEDVGVKVIVREVQRELYSIKGDANELDVGIWHFDRATDLSMYPEAMRFVPPWNEIGSGVPWATWDKTKGKTGEEPPEIIKRLFELRDEWLETPFGTEKFKKLGKEIATINAKNLFQIGTVGMSPVPIIVKNELRNIPKEAVGKITSFIPPQWFFKK